VIDALLPPPVAAVESRDAAGSEDLLAAERAALGRASPKRLAEFAAGRRCARAALERIGATPIAVLRGADRQPCWPAGVVGSITHCAGYCAAAVAPATTIATLGIDAEVAGPISDGVLEHIALPEEARFIRRRAGDGICWGRLLFSAKESTFKAWYPLARRWLDFDEARIVFDPAAATFQATLLVEGPPHGNGRLEGFEGRFALRGGLVLTAIALPR
jgi:4'-phosphopantetheinyl transferase EntD